MQKSTFFNIVSQFDVADDDHDINDKDDLFHGVLLADKNKVIFSLVGIIAVDSHHLKSLEIGVKPISNRNQLNRVVQVTCCNKLTNYYSSQLRVLWK